MDDLHVDGYVCGMTRNRAGILYGIAFIVFSLSGCVLVSQHTAETAKTQLVGKSKSEILSCMGVPSATYRDGNTEYLAYGGSGRMRGSHTQYLGSGAFISSGHKQSQCVATLAFQNNVLSRVTYRSSGGALTAPDEACGVIVSGCLR